MPLKQPNAVLNHQRHFLLTKSLALSINNVSRGESILKTNVRVTVGYFTRNLVWDEYSWSIIN
jgi:hypothetical protein